MDFAARDVFAALGGIFGRGPGFDPHVHLKGCLAFVKGYELGVTRNAEPRGGRGFGKYT